MDTSEVSSKMPKSSVFAQKSGSKLDNRFKLPFLLLNQNPAKKSQNQKMRIAFILLFFFFVYLCQTFFLLMKILIKTFFSIN